jgi:hypothetical protein
MSHITFDCDKLISTFNKNPSKFGDNVQGLALPGNTWPVQISARAA